MTGQNKENLCLGKYDKGVDCLGLRFRKSVKIAPGIKLNFNKKSTGLTFGGKGFHYTINSKGKRTKSVGIPGTGLYYSTSSSGSKNEKSKGKVLISDADNYESREVKNMSDKKFYKKSWFIILMLIFVFPVGLLLMWMFADWKKGSKIALTIIVLLLLIISSVSPEEPQEVQTTESTTVSTTATTKKATTKETTTKETTTEETTEETTETTTEEPTTEDTTTEITTEKITDGTTEEITETETEYDVGYTDGYYSEDYNEAEEEPYYEEKSESVMVWIPGSGSKYHSYEGCSNMKNPSEVTEDEAISRGYSACSKCW